MVAKGAEGEFTPAKRLVGSERLRAASELQQNDFHATPGSQPLHDPLQDGALFRRDLNELNACLVPEMSSSVLALYGVDDAAVDHPGGEDQRADGRRKVESACGSWAQQLSVFDSGSGDAEVNQANL